MSLPPNRPGLPAFVALLLALAVAGPSELDAQEAEDRPSGAGFFSIGVHQADLDALDAQLASAGYPTAGNSMLSLGGGGYSVKEGGLLLGGEGYGLMTGEGVVDGRSVSVAGGYGVFNLGWMFPVTERVRVYPLGSVGGGGLTLGIGPAGTSDSFDDVLEDPGREARISRGGLVVGGGVGAEVRVGGGDHGLVLGLRAGYLAEPLSSAWRMVGSAVSGGPDSGLEGLYLRFSIGGGG